MLTHKQYSKWLAISAVALSGLVGCGGGNTTAPTATAPTATAPATTAPATTAPTNTAQTGGNAPLNADQAEDAIENALEADTRLKGFDLDADEDKGSVALKGTVQNTEQKALAEEIAKQNAPGISIVNQIGIAANASSNQAGKPPADADEAEDRVSDAFKANTTLKALNIDADEDNGGILLKGNVQTAEQRTLAENIAKQAASNFPINNQIQVVQ